MISLHSPLGVEAYQHIFYYTYMCQFSCQAVLPYTAGEVLGKHKIPWHRWCFAYPPQRSNVTLFPYKNNTININIYQHQRVKNHGAKGHNTSE